ncbi:D-alanyl-D-alanine carboxypeptidase family protein [Terrisporobacter vanillatitrophus]|uniref:D-alanyl-D-alanine carboxypeptidase family protein n=1 Tax=Terrisporobacter vanillatitrophus TaxID=3058402 RepID=UPI003369B589
MRNKSFNTFILTILLVICTSLSSVANGLSNTGDIPGIIAQSAIVMDMDTGEVIASKNAQIQRPVASTIKLLTSLVFAENISKGEVIPFTQESLKTTQTALNNLKRINVGDKISSDDLMKAVMVYSANDAAYLMADSVAGNYKDFVKMMNDKAKTLGLKDTKVVNPCGLETNAVDPDNKEINISTAYDIAVIAKEAYKNQWIRETISDQSSNITINIEGEAVPIKLRNKILGQYGNVGGKTGNEVQAGHCFVGFFQREGRNLVTVALNSDYGIDGTNVFNDTKTIVDYGFGAEKQVFKKAGEEVGTIELQYRRYGIIGPKKNITAPVIATEDIMYYKNDINDENAKIEYHNENKSAWKLANKDVKLNFILPNYSSEVSGKVDLNKLNLLKIYASSFIIFIVKTLILLVIVAYSIRLINLRRKRMRRKKRNNRKRK